MSENNLHQVSIISDRKSSLDSLRISLVGRVQAKTETVSRVFDSFALALVERGKGWFCQGQADPVRVEAPAVLYLYPEKQYEFGPDADGWDERYLVFEGARPDEWLRAGWLPDAAGPWILAQPVSVSRAHERIFELTRDRIPDSIDRAKLELEALIFQLYASRQKDPQMDDPLAERIELWRGDPGRDWKLETEAARCGLSYSRFRETFRERFDLSPHQLLLEFRMELAGRLLLEQSLPIKAIAELAGFTTVEGFYRAFRRYYGEAPAAFRERRRL